MRRYWFKIAGGALAIFVVVMLVIRGVEGIRGRVQDVMNGSGDVTIPLMGIMPLSIGGVRYGRLNKIQIHRDAPKHVSGVTLVARLDDSVDSDRFDACDFTVGHATHIDEHTTFTCLDSIPAGMREFGTVRFVDEDGDEDLTRPLVLTEADIRDVQDNNGGGSVRINTDSIQAVAESAGNVARRMGDSIRRVMEQRYGRGAPDAPVPPAAPRAPSKQGVPASRATPKTGPTTVSPAPGPHPGT